MKVSQLIENLFFLLALLIQTGVAFFALFVVIFIITGIATYFGVMELILFIPLLLRIFEVPAIYRFVKENHMAMFNPKTDEWGLENTFDSKFIRFDPGIIFRDTIIATVVAIPVYGTEALGLLIGIPFWDLFVLGFWMVFTKLIAYALAAIFVKIRK